MRVMNMPGFSAEDALYVSKGGYRRLAHRALAPKADIRPQLSPWWPEDCIPGCVCVWGVDCPCCPIGRPRPGVPLE
jgi:hypothetical protein